MFPQYFARFFTEYLRNIEVWFMHQKCTYPEDIYWPTAPSRLLDELDTDFDTPHTRTFRFVERIGCLKSFPGLFLPTYQSSATSYDHGGIPMLCEVKDKSTGEIIYKDDSVNKIGAENNQKEYYNKEGMRMQNP